VTVRWLRHLPALLAATGIVLGPPLLLAWWLYYSAPRWPTTNQFFTWIADPLTEQTLTVGIVFLAGVLWAIVAGIILADLLQRVPRVIRRLRRLSLPTPAQATASSLAGVAVFGVPAGILTTGPPDTGPPSTPTPSAPLDHDQQQSVDPDGARTVTRSVGVDLPDGGWVPDPVAYAVASAAGVVWLHRRRLYRPGTGSHHDLTPLPGTVTALQAATLPDSAGDAPDPNTRRRKAPLLPIGDLPAGVITLAGPGAHAAARGILVATVLSALVDGTARLAVSADDLTTLLGDVAADLPTIPGLQITNTHDAVLSRMDHPPAGSSVTADGMRVANDGQSPLALLIVLTRTPVSADETHRLAGILGHCPPHTAVLLSEQPNDTTYLVDADGYLHHPAGNHPSGSRLCVLSPRAAVDLLTVTALAHPPTTATGSPPGLVAGAKRTTSRPPLFTDQGSDEPSTLDAEPSLRLRVLGRPQLTFKGAPLQIRRSAAFQALVLLALHPDGVTARHLAEVLWPGLHPHSTAQRFYTTISELRGTLHTATGVAVVRRHDERYVLDPEHIDVDVWHLHAAIDQAATAPTPDHRRAALTGVVRAYTGEPGAGMSWTWLPALREVLRRHVIDAYTELAEASASPEELYLLQGAAAVDPLNDDLHRRVRRALIDAGEHNAATRMRHRYLRLLADEGLLCPDDSTHG
jgi:DNA-binding SARP family transcriptional activator